jgi:hypothetical protein
MSRSGWEKSPYDRKEEAFHAPDENKKTRPKTSKRLDKPYIVQYRYTKIFHPSASFLLEWGRGHKFETLEEARKYLAKLKREAWADRREFRIIELREGIEHVVD